jgi:hypothetical protein
MCELGVSWESTWNFSHRFVEPDFMHRPQLFLPHSQISTFNRGYSLLQVQVLRSVAYIFYYALARHYNLYGRYLYKWKCIVS